MMKVLFISSFIPTYIKFLTLADVGSTGSMSRLKVIQPVDVTSLILQDTRTRPVGGRTYAQHRTVGKVRLKLVRPLQDISPAEQKVPLYLDLQPLD
jgi:hypothetical protein